MVNAPSQYLGFSGQVASNYLGGIGIYLDAKWDIDSPRDDAAFIDSLTAAEVDNEIGDEPLRDDDSWSSYNLAFVRSLTPELIAYAGVGLAQRTAFREYRDESGQRGIGGIYVVENSEQSGSELNLMGGAFFRIQRRLFVQFGLESKPGGVTVGLTYLLPLRR